MSYHSDDYNPRFGFGRSGRVNKDDFSIDGKSWEYRNPKNYNDNDSEWSSANDTYNNNAIAITNPLYDYNYGTVRDAAKKLGIGNVDEKAEVDQLLKYIQEGPEKETKVKQSKKDKNKPKAQDFKDEYVDKVIENTLPEPKFVPQQSIGDVTGGDNSIVSPISQDNDISITGDSNTVNQNNSIEQMMKNMRQSLRFAY